MIWDISQNTSGTDLPARDSSEQWDITRPIGEHGQPWTFNLLGDDTGLGRGV